jgi:ribonuclease E
MDHSSNVRKVEKAMKEALKNDRARIQVGRISSFGLMEMSRQRLRTGVLEASTRQCPHCEGTGLVRTASSAGLSALRLIEDEAARGRGSQIVLRASQEAAFYLLNRKRAELAEIEDRYGVRVEVIADGEDEGARMSVEAAGPPPAHPPRFDAPVLELDDDLPEEEEDEIEQEVDETSEDDEGEDRGERQERRPREARDEGEGRGRGRRRRRGRGRGRDRDDAAPREAEVATGEEGVDDVSVDGAEVRAPQPVSDEEGGEPRRRRRRGRRGGRRGDRVEGESLETTEGAETADDGAPEPATAPEPEPELALDPEAAAEPQPDEKPRRGRRKKAVPSDAPAADVVETAAVEAPVAEAPVAEAAEKPKRTRRKKPVEGETEAAVEPAPEPVADASPEKPKRTRRKKPTEAEGEAPAPEPEAVAAAEPEAEEVPADTDAAMTDDAAEGGPRRGWWRRTFGE